MHSACRLRHSHIGQLASPQSDFRMRLTTYGRRAQCSSHGSTRAPSNPLPPSSTPVPGLRRGPVPIFSFSSPTRTSKSSSPRWLCEASWLACPATLPVAAIAPELASLDTSSVVASGSDTRTLGAVRLMLSEPRASVVHAALEVFGPALRGASIGGARVPAPAGR
eukprot:1972417-Rhodomonas_salina.3